MVQFLYIKLKFVIFLEHKKKDLKVHKYPKSKHIWKYQNVFRNDKAVTENKPSKNVREQKKKDPNKKRHDYSQTMSYEGFFLKNTNKNGYKWTENVALVFSVLVFNANES